MPSHKVAAAAPIRTDGFRASTPKGQPSRRRGRCDGASKALGSPTRAAAPSKVCPRQRTISGSQGRMHFLPSPLGYMTCGSYGRPGIASAFHFGQPHPVPLLMLEATMRIRIEAACTLLAVMALLPGERLEAQAPSGVEVTPYAGYMIFEDLVSGPVGTSLGSADGPIFGAQIGVPLLPGLKLVGHVAHVRSSLRAGVPIVGGIDFGNSRAWLYDGGLELSVPLGSGATPFLQVGAGGIRQEFEVSGVGTGATSFALNAGLGLDIPVGSRVGLRLMGRDYVGRFDFREAVLVEVDDEIRHNVALSAGLRISF